jgi:hypothetical protein
VEKATNRFNLQEDYQITVSAFSSDASIKMTSIERLSDLNIAP